MNNDIDINEYEIARYSSESVTVKHNGVKIFSVDIGRKEKSGKIFMSMEDDNEVVDLEVDKEIAVELFAGIINVLSGI